MKEFAIRYPSGSRNVWFCYENTAEMQRYISKEKPDAKWILIYEDDSKMIFAEDSINSQFWPSLINDINDKNIFSDSAK